MRRIRRSEIYWECEQNESIFVHVLFFPQNNKIMQNLIKIDELDKID